MRNLSFLAAFLLSSILSGVTTAQTTWGIEGTLPSYGEFNAPPPCPTDPLPYAVNGPPTPPPGCPANAPFSPLSCLLGGSAVDNDGNIYSGGPSVPAVLHTDGLTIEMTDMSGAYILSVSIPPGSILPGTISGLAYDSADDVTWITDGLFAAGISLNPCAPPTVLFPPFQLPIPTLATGLGYDPCTDTLWVCECAAVVVNLSTSGAFIDAFVAPAIGPNLSGLTVNTTNGNIQITDGFSVAECTPAGVLAPTGPFYLSANPYPIAPWAGPVDGLGFSLRPQNYGVSCPSPGPVIGSTGGFPWAGNLGFALTQSGATPGYASVLILSLGYSCPPIPIGGCPAGSGLWLSLPFLAVLGAGSVSADGTLTTPLPIPPPTLPCFLPIGIGLFAQYINFGSGIETTDALTFTIGQI